MSKEIIVSKKLRLLTDSINKVWTRISLWTRAVDVFFNSGKNAQDTLGNIYGISDSLTSTSSNIAASTAAIKAINDKVTGIKLGDATQADVLTGKKFSSKNGLNKSGTMVDKGGSTVTASTVAQNGDNAEITIPTTGYYNTSSKLSVPIETLKNNVSSLNSGSGYLNIANMRSAVYGTDYDGSSTTKFHALRPILFVGSSSSNGDSGMTLYNESQVRIYNNRQSGTWIYFIPAGYYWHDATHHPGQVGYFAQNN